MWEERRFSHPLIWSPMKSNRLILALCALALLNAATLHADDAKPDADGFISMFNGKDLTGWDGLEGSGPSRKASSAAPKPWNIPPRRPS